MVPRSELEFATLNLPGTLNPEPNPQPRTPNPEPNPEPWNPAPWNPCPL
jgi:hypothetical protein